MEKKKWYQSKVLWTNAIGLVAMVIQQVTGHEIIDIKLQAEILAGINFILRFFTKSELS